MICGLGPTDKGPPEAGSGSFPPLPLPTLGGLGFRVDMSPKIVNPKP